MMATIYYVITVAAGVVAAVTAVGTIVDADVILYS